MLSFREWLINTIGLEEANKWFKRRCKERDNCTVKELNHKMSFVKPIDYTLVSFLYFTYDRCDFKKVERDWVKFVNRNNDGVFKLTFMTDEELAELEKEWDG